MTRIAVLVCGISYHLFCVAVEWKDVNGLYCNQTEKQKLKCRRSVFVNGTLITAIHVLKRINVIKCPNKKKNIFLPMYPLKVAVETYVMYLLPCSLCVNRSCITDTTRKLSSKGPAFNRAPASLSLFDI